MAGLLGQAFGSQQRAIVDQVCGSVRRLARLARATLQTFAASEDAEFLCEVSSYDLVGVLAGGEAAQPKEASLAKELQGRARARAAELHQSAVSELLGF